MLLNFNMFAAATNPSSLPRGYLRSCGTRGPPVNSRVLRAPSNAPLLTPSGIDLSDWGWLAKCAVRGLGGERLSPLKVSWRVNTPPAVFGGPLANQVKCELHGADYFFDDANWVLINLRGFGFQNTLNLHKSLLNVVFTSRGRLQNKFSHIHIFAYNLVRNQTIRPGVWTFAARRAASLYPCIQSLFGLSKI